METQVIAVDWSGRKDDEEEFIWLATARQGRLCEPFTNGASREELVKCLAARVADHQRTVVGMDFAFSFPEWFCREELGAQTGRDVWRSVAKEHQRWLDECPPPFRNGESEAAIDREQYRQTEKESPGPAKSVFKLGGRGAVGKSSLRGMACLVSLTDEHDFTVWPFESMEWPRIIEIYPRALVRERVTKTRHRDRRQYLEKHYGADASGPQAGQDPVLLERAAGSDDAFDAAISALTMTEQVSELESLFETQDRQRHLEGQIWAPTA